MNSTRTWRLLQLTDLHLFADLRAELQGVITQDSFQRVWEATGRLRPAPDLVLLTGDLAHDDSPAVYQRIALLCNQRGLPTAWIPGNHDDPALLRQHAVGCITDRCVIELGPRWRVVLLDTQQAGAIEGELSPAASSAVEAELALQDEAGCFTLLVMHHPPFSVGAEWLDALGLRGGQELLERWCRHPSLRAILTGHVHQEFDGWHRSVRLLTAPACAFQFVPHAERGNLDSLPPGYRVIDLAEDGSLETHVGRVTPSR